MSNPKNPLNEFTSYSYQQVLVVCSNTTVAEELSSDSTIASFNVPPSEKYSRQQLGSGSYVVLINGATDGEFNIISSNWKNVFAPNKGPTNIDVYTTISVTGEINVVEPRGFRFLNILNTALDDLNTDPTGAVFMLKTFFIGFTKTSTKSINNIKPFLFTIFQITSDIDGTRSEYKFAIAGTSNGTSQRQYISDGGKKIQLAVPPNTTVYDAITTHLSKEINDRYSLFVQQLRADAIKLGKDFDGRPIKYTFIVDNVYNDPKYVIDQFPDYSTHTGNNDPIITFGDKPTIESVLNKIMKHSSGVIKLDGEIGDNINGQTQKYVYKILTTIRSSEIEYELVYVIRRYSISESDQSASTITTSGNVLELDYIYTGRNVDILELDIKMNMGLVFFQTLATTNNLSDNKDFNPNLPTLAKGQNATQPTESGSPRAKNIIFFSTNVEDVTSRDVKDSESMASFDALLARHAVAESITNNVTITGNPFLLDNVTRTPTDIISNTPSNNPLDIIRYPDTITPLCKINIQMPRTFKRFESLEPFWYQGYYRISTVEHTFDDGSFTQKLNLIALVTNT